ncbi:MAG: hypothetical protein ACKN9W_06965 [Methylococcus sp.]
MTATHIARLDDPKDLPPTHSAGDLEQWVASAIEAGRQDELISTLEHAIQTLLKSRPRHDEKQARQQAMLRAYFTTAETHIDLAYWKMSRTDTYAIEQRGPYPAAELKAKKDSGKRRFVVYWRNGYHKVSTPREDAKPPKSAGVWRLYVPDAPQIRLWNPPPDNLGGLKDRLQSELLALRRLIQKNHPDKGGERQAYEEAVSKLEALREIVNRCG